MTNPDQLALKAGELYRSNRSEEALELLQQALGLHPSHGLSLEYKGLVLQRLGRFEEAMTCWDVLIANKGEVAMYYGERGVCKFNLGFKSALDDLHRAVELDPSNPYRYSARAYIKDKIGDIRGAIHDYNKCLELDPEDAIALNNLGIAEQKIGNTRRAEDFFDMADDLVGVEKRNPEERLVQKEEKIELEATAVHQKLSRKEKWRRMWVEVRKMISSRKGFASFLRDLGQKG